MIRLEQRRLAAGSARASLRAGLIVALLLAVVGAARPLQAAPSSARSQTFQQLRQQGVHYYDKKLLLPATKALEQAAATPEGARDFKTHSYLAKAYYDQLIVEKAFPAAKKAVELAVNEDQERNAKEFLEALETSYGGVSFQRDPEQKTELKETYIHLKDQGGLINVKKKEAFGKIQRRFMTTKVKLPITLYLPFGKYTANGAPFETKLGETARANLFMYGTAPDTGIPWYWYAGGAAVVAGGTAVLMAVLLGSEEEVQKARFDTVQLLNP